MRTSLTATTEKKMFLEPIVPGSTSTVLQEMILSRTRSVLDISHEDTRKLWKILSGQRERVLTRHRTLL